MQKRFTNLDVWEMGAENTAKLLNELHEENEELKEQRHEDINDLSVIAMKYKAIEKENEQLKLELQHLHQAMSREEVRHKQFKDKIFCQIDCKIKQLKDCYMVNEAKIIEDLKEELIWND